jgi:hypothetical protein
MGSYPAHEAVREGNVSELTRLLSEEDVFVDQNDVCFVLSF